MPNPTRSLALAFLCALLVAAPGLLPARAQDAADPLNWTPAGFHALVRVDLTNPIDTLDKLNIAYYMASFLQPARLPLDRRRTYDDFFSLDLLDTENATFETTILPWLAGDVTLAYRAFGGASGAQADDVLMILPVNDPFVAANYLSTVIEAQDFLQRATYRDATIYVGDRTAIALTPEAVLIGSEPVLQAALDARAGEGERLADDPAFAAVRDAAPEDGTAFAFVSGDETLRALSAMLNGSASAEPLLAALGEALAQYREGALETALLNGEVDSIGLTLKPDNIQGVLRATATIQTTLTPETVTTTSFDADVLTLIPRSAMVVQSGANARSALYDALLALPLSGFASQMLGGFPLVTPTPSGNAVATPTSGDIKAAVSGFMTALVVAQDFDLEEDLLAHLNGSYAIALIPRPNNPAPLSGLPFDALMVAQTDDAEAVVDGAMQFVRHVLNVDEDVFETATVEGVDFNTIFIAPIGEPLVQIGAADDLLIVGTGNAAELALRARRGDNRLVNMERWQAVSRDAPPALYVDLNALYNTFFPTPGGPASQGIGQLGMNSRYLGGGLYRMDITITLPENL